MRCSTYLHSRHTRNTFSYLLITCFSPISCLMPVLNIWHNIGRDRDAHTYISMCVYVSACGVYVCWPVVSWCSEAAVLVGAWLYLSLPALASCAALEWIPHPASTMVLWMPILDQSQFNGLAQFWLYLSKRNKTHSTSQTMMTCFFMDGFIFFKSYLEKQFRIYNCHFYERKKCSCDILSWDIVIVWC